ncbi:WD40 repeat domain-containing protein [Geoalkalibacter sp.]|uniref:WD40 repeat domain-containing protein n=1 Tax=Geoalkalibacter sp. TaxID=3041440 RepID=UPI00272EBA59|nr:WD40 repeat domain-containing protein [Geoalkalibacter sp.]
MSAGSGLDTRDKKPIQETSPVNPEQIFSNYAGVVLWELPSGRPLFKLPGNSVKTNATLSPDGKYVVGGSENGIGFVWRTDTGEEVHRLASLFHGVWTKDTSDDPDKWYDKTGLIPTPSDLNSREAILALRFIDAEHYLCFLTYSAYAVLYHIDSPLPLKYLFLGRDPLPAVRDYHRNAAMDTAPEAGILVMGQQYEDGIIVYRYDAETQELEKVWVADP